jgi:ribonuclease J
LKGRDAGRSLQGDFPVTSITIYDGAQTIGGNKIFVEEKGKGIFLDFGKNFGKYSRYYEEFLKNRDTRGIHDLHYLGLIPKLNIYRRDLIPADVSLQSYPKLNIAAVLLSHAHLDHCGNIGLLDNSIPIVASPMSIAILKGMQDLAKSSVDGDTCYISEREACNSAALVLKSGGAKQPYVGKDFYATEDISATLTAFLSRKPGQEAKSTKKLSPGLLDSYRKLSLPFTVSAFPVDHSIYGSTAYLLEGSHTIAYTGDFRLHGKTEQTTREFVASAKAAEILIIEGTRVPKDLAQVDGFRATEKDVENNCSEIIKESSGLVIADFSARNFERLELFGEIARKLGRKLIVTAKDMYMLHALEQANGVNHLENIYVYDEIIDHEDGKRKWETEVVRIRAGDRYVSPQDIRKSPGAFILCFSFFDMKHLLDIKPDGGTYIYSSCEPFNEEMEIDFKRLWEWLVTFNLAPKGIAKNVTSGEVDIEPGLHASGHASPKDLEWVITQINPEVIIPVHTENKQWFADTFDGVVMLNDGDCYEC